MKALYDVTVNVVAGLLVLALAALLVKSSKRTWTRVNRLRDVFRKWRLDRFIQKHRDFNICYHNEKGLLVTKEAKQIWENNTLGVFWVNLTWTTGGDEVLKDARECVEYVEWNGRRFNADEFDLSSGVIGTNDKPVLRIGFFKGKPETRAWINKNIPSIL